MYSLLFASMDGEDGNGLKLEKTGQFFEFGDGIRRKLPTHTGYVCQGSFHKKM